MRTKLTYLTALFGASAAAVAVLTAPMAAAATADGNPCPAKESATICHSPGNVQINDAPPPVNFDPYGGYGFALGAVR